MKLFILLDTSGSMEGAKIGSLNDCMCNIIIDFQEKAFNKTEIEMSVLSFGREITWMYDSPKSILDFTWKELHAGGMTPLGNACIELTKYLNENSDINKDNIILLLSDGCPTDDYEEGIDILNKNVIFNSSKRFAIALGDDADLKSLLCFTGSKENIYEISNLNDLFDILNNISTKELNKKNNKTRVNNAEDEWD